MYMYYNSKDTLTVTLQQFMSFIDKFQIPAINLKLVGKLEYAFKLVC